MTSEEFKQSHSSPVDVRDLISLTAASELSGLSSSHLRLLVSNGDLWGIKIGRNWLTSMNALKTYLDIEHKPGPKPKIGN